MALGLIIGGVQAAVQAAATETGFDVLRLDPTLLPVQEGCFNFLKCWYQCRDAHERLRGDPRAGMYAANTDYWIQTRCPQICHGIPDYADWCERNVARTGLEYHSPVQGLTYQGQLGFTMPIGRIYENGGGPVSLEVVGRAPVPTPAPVAFMGGSEFTTSIGSPPMAPTAIVVREPSQQQTPQPGAPGGSFNYNALLSSILKWDIESVGSSIGGFAAGLIANEISIPNAGVWAVELSISGLGLPATGMQYNLAQRSHPSGAVVNFHAALIGGADVGGQAVTNQFVRIWTARDPTSATTNTLRLVMVDAGIAATRILHVLRLKQLSGV